MAGRSARAARIATRRRPGTGPASRGAATPAGVAGLDALVHARLRLGILSALSAAPSLSFVELKERLAATDGNLSVHARKLEVAGYVACVKGFDGRVPCTEYRLTDRGRRALTRYLGHMGALKRAIRRS
jgi:DNA-binding MarR family transcriptional regulator